MREEEIQPLKAGSMGQAPSYKERNSWRSNQHNQTKQDHKQGIKYLYMIAWQLLGDNK